MTFTSKRLVAHLPKSTQQALRRHRFRKQIIAGTFRTPEPEWDEVANWLKPGDWAIDVGANIGHYAIRFSELVGPQGRVIAFEPVPETFELLAANTVASGRQNFTLVNAAASASTASFGMTVPNFDTGLANYYEASINSSGAGIQVIGLGIDGLNLPHTVRLIKVDAEGHDLNVLQGAEALIRRDKPIIVIESGLATVREFLVPFGYDDRALPKSPNRIYECGAR